VPLAVTKSSVSLLPALRFDLQRNQVVRDSSSKAGAPSQAAAVGRQHSRTSLVLGVCA
jgi:hypothetical protein